MASPQRGQGEAAFGWATTPSVARAAYFASAANLVALGSMLVLLQPGLPMSNTLPEDRLAYLAGHTLSWAVGWIAWHVAAISMLSFDVGLAALWGRRAPIRCGVAVLCAAAGMAADLGAQGIYIVLAPGLDVPSFTLLESGVTVLTAYIGNGLYTVGGILLTWVGVGTLPRPLLWVAALAWIGGIGLSVSTLLQSSDGQFVSTALLMPAFVLWAALTGRWLSRRES